MICTKCNAFHSGFSGRLCPVCSEPLVSETSENRDKLVLGRIQQFLQKWKTNGQISNSAYKEFEKALQSENQTVSERPKEEYSSGFLYIFSLWASELIKYFFKGLAGLFEPMLQDPKKKSFRNSRSSKSDLYSPTSTDSSDNLSGLEVFSELDGKSKKRKSKFEEEPEIIWSGLKPLFNEYIWWFIGSLLVLTGSIMGIREAWMVLSGVSRSITILSAIFIYQALFVGLGLLLSRRSVTTGKLLSGISILLLPVVFSVISDIVFLEPITGFIVLSILVVLTLLLYSAMGKLYQISVLNLALPILPSMVVLSTIPIATNKVFSLLLLFIPLIFVGNTARNIYKQKSGGNKWLLLLSLYGSLSVVTVFSSLPSTTQAPLLVVGDFQTAAILLWAISLCYILAISFYYIHIQSETSKLYIVLEILFLAIILSIATGSGFYIYNTNSANPTFSAERILYIALMVIPTLLFLHTTKRHIASIHPFMELSIFSSFIISREYLPIGNWHYALFSAIPILGLLFYERVESRMQWYLSLWGIGSGLLSCLLLLNLDFPPNTMILPLLVLGIFFSLIVHKIGSTSNFFFHYFAVLGSYSIVQSILNLYPIPNSLEKAILSFGVISILYNVVVVFYHKLIKDIEELIDSHPLDDIAILSSVITLIGVSFVNNNSLQNWVIILTGVLTIFRSFRDKSLLISFLGFILCFISGIQFGIAYYGFQTIAGNVFFSSSIVLAIGVITGILPSTNIVVSKAKKILYVMRLPFPAEGLSLIRDSLIATSFVFVVYSFSLIFRWYGIVGQPERNLVILSGVFLSLFFLIVFFAAGFNPTRLRGSVFTLTMIFFSVGLTAIANRIGRPLPPSVVGFNLSLGVIGLWIFSRFLYYIGDKLATLLKNPTNGRFYHYVPLNTMLLLGLVLLVDAFLVGPPTLARFLYVTPPTFFIGFSIALFLYTRVIHSNISLLIAPGFLIISLALIFSQNSIKGIELVPLDPPGGRWIPVAVQSIISNLNWLDPNIFLPNNLTVIQLMQSATLGISVAGLLYALIVMLLSIPVLKELFSKYIFPNQEVSSLENLFSFWFLFSVGLLVWIGYSLAFIHPATVVSISGIILLPTNHFIKKLGMLSIGIGGLLLIEGFAHLGTNYPFWAGPLLVSIALLMVVGVKPIGKIAKIPYSKILESFHAGAFIYTIVGYVYALATYTPATIDNAIPGLVSGFFIGIFGQWIQSLAWGSTLFISSVSMLVAAYQWTKVISIVGSTLGILLATFSGIFIFPLLCFPNICSSNTLDTIPLMLSYFALITSIGAFASYFLSGIIPEDREDYSAGFHYASDILILFTGLFLGIFIRLEIVSNLRFSNLVGLIPIVLVIVVTASASFKTLKPRHLYFLQTAIASLYLGLKPAFPQVLTPQVDAIAALIFGFILIGVTSVAQKIGIPPLAETTRRFAALMPLVAAIVLPTETTFQNAGMAIFSAALYAALGVVSSNRIYAVLSAIAANFAIYLAIMASNVNGLEIYLAPIGLFSIFLGHIFRENLSDLAKKILRISGGLLLYLPAAINISLEMGRANDAMYAIVFGVVCLVGIAAGMLFQIRSYLFMGVTFFTLDVIANLLQKGLRDQRMGFILLSLTGLGIIGSLIYYTLKKDQVIKVLQKIKRSLAGWE